MVDRDAAGGRLSPLVVERDVRGRLPAPLGGSYGRDPERLRVVSFPLEIIDPEPTDAELVLAAWIAADYPGACLPQQVAKCEGCRCRHEAREMLAKRKIN